MPDVCVAFTFFFIKMRRKHVDVQLLCRLLVLDSFPPIDPLRRCHIVSQNALSDCTSHFKGSLQAFQCLRFYKEFAGNATTSDKHTFLLSFLQTDPYHYDLRVCLNGGWSWCEMGACAWSEAEGL